EADLINKLLKVFNKISQYSAPTWKILNDFGKNDKVILFEGAQGALLDIDFGTYPFVTSSNTSSGQIFAGTGFGIKDNHQIFGITKAYTTRVGSGPFPSELFNKVGDHLVLKGQEFGTVTKRKRRCGWFDTNLVKQTVQISGVSDIVLTKLDILDELKEVKICVGYSINNSNYDYLPFNENLQKIISPIYEIMPGWQSSTFGITKWSELPKNAQNYINYIEEVVETKIAIISTGPERSQTIDRNNI
ncbi:uncharacterized protein METZ01_LOCUS472259, partial [marine metagenome]